jgi:quercetin dioxygenase-like cupin family protein
LSLAEHLSRIVPQDASKRSLILVKSDELRVVLLRMSAGADLREHSAPGLITIHAISGRFTVLVGEERYDLTNDGLLVIERDVRHSVICEEDGAFLLTIAWPHGADAVSSGEE